MTIGDEKVRRYEPRMVGFCDRPPEAGMYISLHGHYVLHSAYAELEKHSEHIEVAYLASESRAEDAETQLAELRGKLEGLADMFDAISKSNDSKGGEHHSGKALAYETCANELRTLAAAEGE